MASGLSVMSQVRRINKNLLRVAEEARGPVEQTLFTQAALIAAEIRANAPVDEESATPGALKETVRVEKGEPTPKHAYVVKIKAGGEKTKKKSGEGFIYDFARAVEFGTQKVAAYPFFFSIWRARRKDVRAAVRKVIKVTVPKVFR